MAAIFSDGEKGDPNNKSSSNMRAGSTGLHSTAQKTANHGEGGVRPKLENLGLEREFTDMSKA